MKHSGKYIFVRSFFVFFLSGHSFVFLQAFEKVKLNVCNRMPKDGHKSLILCSDKLENCITLQDYSQGGLYDSAHNTLGQLIQTCLEEKVS